MFFSEDYSTSKIFYIFYNFQLLFINPGIPGNLKLFPVFSGNEKMREIKNSELNEKKYFKMFICMYLAKVSNMGITLNSEEIVMNFNAKISCLGAILNSEENMMEFRQVIVFFIENLFSVSFTNLYIFEPLLDRWTYFRQKNYNGLILTNFK